MENNNSQPLDHPYVWRQKHGDDLESIRNDYKNRGDRMIVYDPVFSKMYDSHVAGILLSYLAYWSQHVTRPDGYFYKSNPDIYEETGLKDSSVKTAKKILEEKNVIDIKVIGSPPTSHYKINYEKIKQDLSEYYAKNIEEYIKKNGEYGAENTQSVKNTLSIG